MSDVALAVKSRVLLAQLISRTLISYEDVAYLYSGKANACKSLLVDFCFKNLWPKFLQYWGG